MSPLALSFVGGAASLLTGPSGDVALWTFPVHRLDYHWHDTIGSWFACIASLVYVPTSLFTLRYLERYAEHYSLRAFTIWYCAMLAAIIGLFICRDVTSFFIDWEVIAIASALLVAFEWRQFRNARAAFVMLGMSEAGTMAALIAMLLARGGSLSFAVRRLSERRLVVGCLSPRLLWLRREGWITPDKLVAATAHPLAPGNVSALLSGVFSTWACTVSCS